MPEEKKPVKAPPKQETPKAETKAEKAGAKTEKKETPKEAKPAEKKGEAPGAGKKGDKKPRFAERKKNPRKTGEAKKAVEKISEKTRRNFRGRFGKNSVRKKCKPKWQRWRVPRGKDLDFTRQYPRAPDSGFILGPSHSIAKGVPYDNFMAMCDEFTKLRDKEW